MSVEALDALLQSYSAQLAHERVSKEAVVKKKDESIASLENSLATTKDSLLRARASLRHHRRLSPPCRARSQSPSMAGSPKGRSLARSRSLSPVPFHSLDSLDTGQELDSLLLSEGDVLKLVDQLLKTYNCGYGNRNLHLFSDNFHKRNPTAAQHFFGFRSWHETKAYVMALFPELADCGRMRSSEDYIKTECWKTLQQQHATSSLDTSNINENGDDYEEEPMVAAESSAPGKARLTQFEHCLIAKLFIHSIPLRRRLALMFQLDESHVGKIIMNWVPRWGKAGEQLSVLVISEDYLEKDMPDEYRLLGYGDVGFLFDGKDWQIQVRRKDSKKQRSGRSSKTHSSAGRDITFTTPAGLCFEFTKLFGGRISEQKLVELWGKLGNAYAPVETWKDYAKSDEYSQKLIRTPLLLRTRKVKQYLRSEIFGNKGNCPLCRLRYTSEVAFARATSADSLKDVISYRNIALLQHMHSWGHAMMNLGNPLRNPPTY